MLQRLLIVLWPWRNSWGLNRLSVLSFFTIYSPPPILFSPFYSHSSFLSFPHYGTRSSSYVLFLLLILHFLFSFFTFALLLSSALFYEFAFVLVFQVNSCSFFFVSYSSACYAYFGFISFILCSCHRSN